MSFFKSLGNIVTAPLKSVGNIARGKISFNDILNVGAPFLPGGALTGNLSNLGTRNLGTASFLGSLGIKDPMKMNLTDYMNFAPRVSGTSRAPKNNQEWMSMFMPMVQAEIGNAMANQPRRFQAQANAYNALDPRNDAQSGMMAQNRLLNQSGAVGRAQGMSLADRGYGSGAQAGAGIDARNRAATQGNEYFLSMLDPRNRAARYMAQAGVYNFDPISMMFGFQNQANNQRVADAQYNATRPPSFLESLLGIGGTVAPYFLQDRKQSPGLTGGQRVAQDSNWIDSL